LTPASFMNWVLAHASEVSLTLAVLDCIIGACCL
jgi:hypothetical protein